MKRPTSTPNPNPESNSSPEELPLIKWTNRRKMAWHAFYYFIGFTSVLWFILPPWFIWWGIPVEWLTILGDTYAWFAMGTIGVVLGYMGFTSLPFMGKGTQRQNYRVDGDDY